MKYKNYYVFITKCYLSYEHAFYQQKKLTLQLSFSVQIMKAAEEVVREVESPRRASRAKASAPSLAAASAPQAETSRPMVVSVASTVVRAAASQLDHTGVMPENLHFMYATSEGSITTLESLLQPVSPIIIVLIIACLIVTINQAVSSISF